MTTKVSVSEASDSNGWRHVTVRIIAASETEARAKAQAAKETLLLDVKQVRWRVPFEYKDQTSTFNGPRWRGFARFSFR